MDQRDGEQPSDAANPNFSANRVTFVGADYDGFQLVWQCPYPTISTPISTNDAINLSLASKLLSEISDRPDLAIQTTILPS
jgi:hypothetical protein